MLTSAEKQKRYRQRHPEKIREYKRLYRIKYPEKAKEGEHRRMKRYRAKNGCKDWNNWKMRHGEKAKKYLREYRVFLYRTNIFYKISSRLRGRLWDALRGRRKIGSHIEKLGCGIEELKKHLENQFREGMTWENYGHKGWHIDHKIPLSAFDLTNPEQLSKACHYTNLQPLWAKDNLSKHNKIIYG